MRAGCFAETRVINLMNRRFVPFYFNTSGMGEGDDESAQEFVAGKLENPYVYLSAFAAKQGGPHLATSQIYADKDDVFEFLMGLLQKHSEFNSFTSAEQQVLQRAQEHPEDSLALIAAAELLEELGRYGKALPLCMAALETPGNDAVRARAWLLAMRMARYEQNWTGLEVLLEDAEEADGDDLLGLAPSIAMERAYMLLSGKLYGEMRTVLDATIDSYPAARRSGELRFYAGVANYFLGDKDAADYHWCFVQEELPDDHMARRCFVAAAREAMPYPNPELGGYAAEGLPGGSIA